VSTRIAIKNWLEQYEDIFDEFIQFRRGTKYEPQLNDPEYIARCSAILEKHFALEEEENFWPLIHIQQIVALGSATDDWEESLQYAHRASNQLAVAEKFFAELEDRVTTLTLSIDDETMEYNFSRAEFDIANLKDWLADFVPGG
jgi:hypothetical protein